MLVHNSTDNCFALLYTARTGSHLCKAALESHPDIVQVIPETYTSPRILDEWWCPPCDKTIITPEPYLTGLKLATDFLVNAARLHEVTCPKIVSYRNNKLSQIISLLLGKRDGFQYSHYLEEKIDVPIDYAIWMINRFIKSEKAVRDMFGDTCLWVEYGEIAAGSCYQKMQEFLQLPVVDLVPEPAMIKQSNKPLIEYVGNVDELLDSPLAGWV